MGDFGNAIKDLYEKFILRDLLSFVMPGAMIVLIGFLLFLPEPCLSQRLSTLFGFSSSMHWLLYIPLFGLSFMAGFAVQCFGEVVGIVQFYPDVKASCRERLKIFTCNWRTPTPLSEKTKFEKMTKFWKATAEDTGARQGRERLVVMKQMCANSFLAIAIIGILLLVNHWFIYPSQILFFIMAFLLLFSLFWGHRVYVLRQDAREQVIMSEYEEKESKGASSSQGGK